MLLTVSNLLDTVGRSGLLDPRRAPSLAVAVTRWGPTLAAPVAASSLVTPDRAVVVDENGPLTYRELDRRSTDLAQGFRQIGLPRGGRLGVMCRNHREFVEVTVAAAKLGLQIVYLNTGSAGPQLAEVAQREGVDALVIDDALLSLVDANRFEGPVIVAHRAASTARLDGRFADIADVRTSGRWKLPLRASTPVPPVLLTSGTTGTPKGAQRSGRVDTSAATAVIREIPYQSNDVIAITSPLFHAWGLAQLGITLALGATCVLSTTFTPADTLARIEHDGVTVLAVVPVILQRLLGHEALDTTDLSSLRIVASSGSALPVPVVEEWLDRVGPNLYNLYGSTEVGQATLATPAELHAAPATAGHVLAGSIVRILDRAGAPVPTGRSGRIFVGSGAQFEGYTGGGGKEIVDGLMSSGDVGHLDDRGLLFVTGRADDMIVSGGENVFPQEIEDLLLAHGDVADVAVVGVDDDEFGQRLVAHVVKRKGARVSAATLRSHVGDHLARHKVPREIRFIDELPRTPTGKIRRTEL